MLIIKADTEKFQNCVCYKYEGNSTKTFACACKRISEDVDFSPETLCVMCHSSLDRENRKMMVVFQLTHLIEQLKLNSTTESALELLPNLQSVLLYDLCVRKKLAAAIHPELGDVYGPDKMNENAVHQRCGTFKDKQTDVHNETTCGRLLVP